MSHPRIIIYIFICLLAFISCNEKITTTNPNPNFAKGADISWVTEMESKGIKFRNIQGEERECTALMKELGMNSIRLRVWVNPKDGWCGKEDFMIKARRAKSLGMRLMVDFHYSDWWADPGKQNKPDAWKTYNIEELKAAVAAHTIDILSELKSEGITPEWVQVGNETGHGMLWDDGKLSTNPENYAQLNNAGYDAVKSIFPEAKVIIHVHSGNDKGLFEWVFSTLKSHNAKWDIIGMSLYPSINDWKQKTDECIENARQLIAKYDTEVMICEVGMSWDQPQYCYSFLKSLIYKARHLPGNRCLGVFYWEPQSNPSWNNYSLGAFDQNWQPTKAMDAFR